MRVRRVWGVLLLRVLGFARVAHGEGPDILDFFREEAEAVRVVTASRLGQSLRWSPATVYVVRQEDIRSSGARTLWDVLRGVPGVDVMSTRAFYGEVSVRGLNKALSNRTLVLLDGRTVLDGPFDSTYWEGIPVALDEIDRIEVVKGPASALYGANAINGVIQIITKEPEAPGGGRASYTVGERGTHLGSVVAGGVRGHAGYKGAMGFRRTLQFENPGRMASRVTLLNGLVRYDLPRGARVSLSAGLSDHDTQFSMGNGGIAFVRGKIGFLRADARGKQARFRAFYNRAILDLAEFPARTIPEATSSVFEASIEREATLSGRNRLVAGFAYRANGIRSNVYDPGRIRQHLGSFFVEEAWELSPSARLVTSGRVDRHPLNGWMLSPRGCLVYSPNPRHSLRLMLGGAFRNPSLTEGYLRFQQPYGTVRNIPVMVDVRGSRSLEPEQMLMAEAGFSERSGPVRATAAFFHFRLKHVITVRRDSVDLIFQPSPLILVPTSYANASRQTLASGGELAIEVSVVPGAILYANVSYQHFEGEMDFQVSTKGGPRWKGSGGFRYAGRGLHLQLWGHWVDRTYWDSLNQATLSLENRVLNDYLLVNGSVRWLLPGARERLSVGLEAFNLTSRRHYQILPTKSKDDFGQSGERIGRRLTATISCQW